MAHGERPDASAWLRLLGGSAGAGKDRRSRALREWFLGDGEGLRDRHPDGARLIFSGSGLDQLTKQQASAVVNANGALGGGSVPNDFVAFDYPWAVQARLLIYIDQFFK